MCTYVNNKRCVQSDSFGVVQLQALVNISQRTGRAGFAMAAGQVPVDKIVLMVNLDMIGRNPDQSIEVSGDGFTRGLKELIESKNQQYLLPLTFSGRSHSSKANSNPCPSF